MADDIHTKSVSRRNAIKGGAAVAVAATVPSVAVADDGKLLSEIAEFRPLFTRYVTAEAQAHAAWEAADADPDKSSMRREDGSYDQAAWDMHWGRYGYHELSDKWNALGTVCRRASVDLFALPAQTVEGVLAKVRLAHEMYDHADETWDIYHDESPSYWTLQIQRDLERLAGGAS